VSILDQRPELPSSASEVVGDMSALLEQLGAADGFGMAPVEAACCSSHQIRSVEDLRRFLDDYTRRVLIARELPAVARSYQHAARYEIRELLSLDKQLAQTPIERQLSNASRAVGRNHLERLRPLRDERLVQRYLRAVDAGEASAWHTVVFGVVLALFSVPLRQGLAHFAQQTLSGFLMAADGSAKTSQPERQELLARNYDQISKAIEKIVAESGPATVAAL
jgi:urease accessory protein UreF